ncbi:hypothetical protein BC826DRAFT_554699 [Russula brevipes]|nr:hypothetical protein BC826DRAFT_554699 [Russula brevipes]
MSALSPVPPRVTNIAAPLLLGGLWNWCLYGVLLVQFYVYSYNFPEDKRSLKLLVYAIFLLETVQTALNCADLFYWFVSGYGDTAHLASPFASSFDVPIIESVVSLIVQFFYAYRIWVLSIKQSVWFSLLICLCSTINAAAAFIGGIYTHVRRRFASGGKLKTIAITWLIGNTAADILIASAMLYYLVRRRRNADGVFSDHPLVKIVRLTVETNLLTSNFRGNRFSSGGCHISPRKLVHVPTFILGKLYSNTLSSR